MKTVTKNIAILILPLLLVGCAVFGDVSPQFDPTNLEKAKLSLVGFMQIYYEQYKDTENMAELMKTGKLSTEQLVIYKQKRELLIKVKPKIDLFDSMVKLGAVPDEGNTREITDLLNQLASKLQ